MGAVSVGHSSDAQDTADGHGMKESSQNIADIFNRTFIDTITLYSTVCYHNVSVSQAELKPLQF